MMSNDPNSRQVGGTHYSHKTGTQHWDLVALADAGYFPGQITKYTERHSRKNGREDLEKALHFAEKWQSVHKERPTGKKFLIDIQFGSLSTHSLPQAIRDYAVDAGLTAIQQRIFEECMLDGGDVDEVVRLCRVHLYREYGEPDVRDPTLIPAVAFGTLATGETSPGTPEDGGHHEKFARAIEDAILHEDAEAAIREALPKGDESTDVATGSVQAALDGVDQDESGPVTRKRGKV